MKQNSTASTSEQADQMATIWSIVEARESFPVMIVVTSATDTDDTNSVARGLAKVANSAGRQTGYLELASTNPRAVGQTPYANLSIDSRGLHYSAFDAAVASWRATYDVVIVNAPNSIAGALRAHAARLSDATIIALRDQRRVVPADRALVRLLEELRVAVLGVVITGAVTTVEVPRVSRERSLLQAAAQP